MNKAVKHIYLCVFLMLLLGVPAVLAWQQSENDTMALAEPPSGEQQQLQETKNSVHRGWFGIPDTNPQSRLIRALIIVIITSTVCQVVLLIWILINRNRIHAVEAKTGRLLEQFQTLLVDYLFSENNNEQFREIQRIAAFDFDRRILINQMIDLSINLSGESKEKLRDLYFKLELDQDSLFKAHSSMWHIQIKGFKEMAFMNIKEASQQIRNALKSKNNILRMEAQLALVRLNEDDPFGFLDDLKRPFTLWEQLNVHELIIFHNLPIPDFSRWTNSTNKTVVIFSLRMIQVFKQTGAMQAIINCLSHPDREVRHTAIRVCGEIQLHDTLPHLKHIYKSEDRDNCLAIIHAMEKMRNESMLGFLKLVLDKEEDVQLQIGAAVAISKMGETGISALVKLMKSEYKDYQIIIRHVLDKRIN
ncbi:MAG: HEAT repeat domain-containing protein [Bacteroidales bacterium]|nr:HEAT repeat domain-containing protein [Bacteroidales bacterium]